MKYYFIRYNKLIYMLYAFSIMLLFNIYSTTSYCEGSIIEEKIKENAFSNNYIYYALTILASITAFCAVYTISAYYFPDLDVLHLFNNNNNCSYNFGLDSLIYANTLENNIIERHTLHRVLETKGDKILVDKNTFDFITEALKSNVKENTQLKETIVFQEQKISNLYKLVDLISSDIKHHPFRRNSI